MKRKKAIVGQWRARTGRDYAERTTRFLLQVKDPFRNPVGHALDEGLPVIFDEIFGGMNREALKAALDSIVRIRAVQDFTAAEAVRFVFDLKEILRKEAGSEVCAGAGLTEIEGRIDEVALTAFDLYMQCREKIYELRANEAKRSVFLQERMRLRHAGRGEDEALDKPGGGNA